MYLHLWNLTFCYGDVSMIAGEVFHRILNRARYSWPLSKCTQDCECQRLARKQAPFQSNT